MDQIASQPINPWHTIADQKQSVFLSAEPFETVFETKIIGLDEQHLILKNTISFDAITYFLSRPSFRLSVLSASLLSPKITSNGKDILFPIENQAYFESFKHLSGICILGKDDWEFECINPIDETTKLTKKILELSEIELSFQSEDFSMLFEPDLMLEAIKIFKHKKLIKQTKGQVLYKKLLIKSNGLQMSQIGVKLFHE